ncbi:CDP-glycerol glycerophosphotransferase family protein [Carboxylicivirga sediminis]|uniref:CDP-glycerol glycerophosphotransferase family protein n=1 Tax=Carboxylicivirga sediminis TaxID=2006564 RepID=A0A941IY78_9BACT|nr:CDP-glycerol glycerophosphotransferase family protein [Carboxylicivirga sediminis]MBR8535527.1 CDP-glycerol glycerophosphotransferase family protein [Carboxylicivirga sediminis]
MRAVLFCINPYAFGILLPLYEELKKQNHDIIWYIPDNLRHKSPDGILQSANCNTMAELMRFNADVNFVPGNVIPHYLPGVKVQIFHGFAGEKKGHFHIRHYFDLYLTQGPYFTERFQQLAAKYKNFEVAETGWCKLDILYKDNDTKKPADNKQHILYAPTFSPRLTSGEKYMGEIEKLCANKDLLVHIKFHDLMNKQIVEKYHQLAHSIDNMCISTEANILPLMKQCDLMISDTSSVVYEFLLLDKPVITLETTSKHIRWDDINQSSDLRSVVENNLTNDPYKAERKWFIDNYHPYADGQSAARMIEAAKHYIVNHGIPQVRKLSFLRRRKMNKMFGKKPQL